MAAQSHIRAEKKKKGQELLLRVSSQGPKTPECHQKIPEHCLVVLVPLGHGFNDGKLVVSIEIYPPSSGGEALKPGHSKHHIP